jgi:hypothetical protein
MPRLCPALPASPAPDDARSFHTRTRAHARAHARMRFQAYKHELDTSLSFAAPCASVTGSARCRIAVRMILVIGL